MEWERGCILASCLGVMRRQLEDCIRHARERKQFGRPIGKNQSVANRIVDMKVRLETCRALVHRIGELKDRNQPAMLEAAMAKLHVSQSLRAVEPGRDPDLRRLRLHDRAAGRTRSARRGGQLAVLRHVGDPAQHHRQGAGP